MAKLNSFNSFFRFTLQSSSNSMSFLDILITVNEDFGLSTEIFRKATDCYAGGLNFNSFHPTHTINSLPYSLAFRSFSLCSNQTHLDKNLKYIRENFIQRGFPVNLIDTQLTKCAERFSSNTVQNISSDGLSSDSMEVEISTLESEAIPSTSMGLATSTLDSTNSSNSTVMETPSLDLTHSNSNINLTTPYLVVDFNQVSSSIKYIVQKHFRVVDPDGRVFANPIVSTRRAPNLRDNLVNVRRVGVDTANTSLSPVSSNVSTQGQLPCNNKRCLLCLQLPPTSTISFPEFKLLFMASICWLILLLMHLEVCPT
jgi:hypothetical protein